MLDWARQFDIFCFLDNAQYTIQPHGFEGMLAAGVSTALSTLDLKDMDRFLSQPHSGVFGHFSYELKAIVHWMPSGKRDRIGFPLFYFFKPQYLLLITEDQL
ncbi:MAG: aminodeoxychorismate synthase component I, partial [Flavisolibacter sp.]